MAVLDILFRPSFLTPVFLFVIYAIYSRIERSKRIPKNIPWANSDERIKRAKTTPDKLKALQEYYTDKGLKYIYGSGVSEPTVVLPPSEISWIISQPESVLSAQEMHREALQSDWVFLDQNIVKSPVHEQVIRGNMVRKLESFTDPVMDELRQCFEDYWGDSTEWHEVNIWDSMMKFFARTSNRMFVGLPMCRDEDFLEACRGFATYITVSGAILKMMPNWLRPALGYVAISPIWWYYRKAATFLLPVIKSRLEETKQHPEKNPTDFLPNDFVTWSIIGALNAADTAERSPELIAKRIMTTNFAAIHTTTMTSTNLLIDLISSNPKLEYLESLAAEVSAIDKMDGGAWSKSALGAMTRTDSALRESMRLSGFVVWGVERKVVAKDGVTLADGTFIPYWANISVPAWCIHHDAEVYENPFDYDALRFAKQREALDGGNRSVHVGEEGLVEGEQGYVGVGEPSDRVANGAVKPVRDLAKVLEGRNLSTVTTGEQFMQFGHGKLSCPGRFFAVQEIKLMMAYLLLNYEVKYLPSKPAPRWLGAISVPNTSATISIRKKETLRPSPGYD